MDRSNLQRRLFRAGSAGALAVGLTAGGFGVASAASSTGSGSTSGGATSGTANGSASTPAVGTNAGPGGPGGPGRGPGGPGGPGHGPGGTITALGANSITIQRPDGTTQTVTTNSSTTYTRDGQTSSASALATGEHVGIRPTAPPSTSSGSTSTPSTVTAAAVNIMDPSVHGTVQSVSNNVLTIVDDQGFWRTVNLSASTTYTNNGQSATQSALTQSAKVVAFGSVDSNHTSLDATSVAVNPTAPDGGHGGPGGPGVGA